MEDKSVVLSINLDNKQKKNLNKKYPATACHSPKRVNDIHSQIDSNLNRESSNKHYVKSSIDLNDTVSLYVEYIGEGYIDFYELGFEEK